MAILFLCGIAREKSLDMSGKVVGAGEAPSLDLGADFESCVCKAFLIRPDTRVVSDELDIDEEASIGAAGAMTGSSVFDFAGEEVLAKRNARHCATKGLAGRSWLCRDVESSTRGLFVLLSKRIRG